MAPFDHSQRKKYLIVAPAWVGDMIMAQALVNLLAQQAPSPEIHLLAPDSTRLLAERMPGVSGVILLPTIHAEFGFRKRWQVAQSLRGEDFTHAVVLPNSWKSALVPLLAGIPVRTGWRGEMRIGLLNDLRRLNKDDLPRMVDRFIALGARATQTALLCNENLYPRLHPNETNRRALLSRFELAGKLGREPGRKGERSKLERTEPVVALCPGAEFGPAKQWPASHFARVADWCVAGGCNVWILGSGSDRLIGKKIMDRVSAESRPRLHNLAGRTDLLDAVDLLSAVDVVVTNDSGLMHVAAALRVPVVALYGSTSPDFTPPLGQAVVLQESLSCQPCFSRECPLGHLKCLTELSVAKVTRAVGSLLPSGISSAVSTLQAE